MSPVTLGRFDPVFLVYVAVFAATAIVCFASVARARLIADADTRRGLVALLLFAGGWAASHVVFLVAPTPRLQASSYVFGLIVGLGAVGPWLYFCSAYTGRTLHEARPFRVLAVVVYLLVIGAKVTNPVHGLYFSAELVSEPFVHVAIHHGLFHWLAMGLAYALATVGYFMLVELFWQVDHDTGPLVVLITLTALPLVLDIAGLASPWVLPMTYEPIGVAAFAVGVLYVYVDDFQTIQLAGERDDPVIVLDDDGEVRDYNSNAEALFPALAIGEPVDSAVPELASHSESEGSVVVVERIGGMRYYQISSNPFSADSTRIGQVLTLTDVTEREEYRTELERQNERLERFASMVSHDLRNPLGVAKGRIELAIEETGDEHLEKAANALDRMDALIEDLLTLAREGQPISETERVSLAAVVEDCWEVVDTAGATLDVESDLTFEADPDRLQQLLENLFRNAIEHGTTGEDGAAAEDGTDPTATVTIWVGAIDGSGFYVEDDGPGIPADEREEVFESGYTTDPDGTGFGLAIVGEIVDAHGWLIDVTEGRGGGARFEVRGVDGE